MSETINPTNAIDNSITLLTEHGILGLGWIVSLLLGIALFRTIRTVHEEYRSREKERIVEVREVVEAMSEFSRAIEASTRTMQAGLEALKDRH